MAIWTITKAKARLLDSVCNRVLKMKGGPGIRVVNGPEGITIALAAERTHETPRAIKTRFCCRITAVSGSFPVWSYTVQRVIGYDSTKTGYEKWLTDGVDLTATNGFEWTPASYPFMHGVGVRVTNSGGAVDSHYSGTSTAGTCKMRSLGVGACVDVEAFIDQGGDMVYQFSEPNSAQQD